MQAREPRERGPDEQIMPEWKQLKRIVYGLGKLFPISPKNLAEGLDVCRVLHSRGIPSTLGKFSKSGDDPAEIACEYQRASDALKSSSTEAHFYLSLKPPAMNFDLEHVTAIAATALKNGQSIHFDSHQYVLTDATVRLLEQLMGHDVSAHNMAGSGRFGLTLPSRWKRSIADAQWVAEKGVRVRLVKGEFKSTHSSDEMDPGKGFLALADRLAGKVPEILVATHDVALAREAIARCKRAGSSVHLELLFGMPIGRMIALSREMAVPVRFYVPYGDTLLLYGIRQFLTNPHKLLRPDFPEVVASQNSKLARITTSL
jgi:proline dehydrogenase